MSREFGWTLDDMRRLYPSELTAILLELQRQVTLEQYNEQRNKWAFLAAVITNGFGAIVGMLSKRKPKTVTPDDFMGKEAKKVLQRITEQKPEREDWSRHIDDAKAKELQVPWG